MSSPAGHGFHLFMFLFFSTSGALKGGPYGSLYTVGNDLRWVSCVRSNLFKLVQTCWVPGGGLMSPYPPLPQTIGGGDGGGWPKGVPKGMLGGWGNVSTVFVSHEIQSII